MKLQFWYDFASTYSYLAAARIETLAELAGVTVEWRPFLLGPIFAAQGWKDSPFNLYPVKGEHMWRDLGRSCDELGLPLKRPGVFPRNSILAARVALVAAEEGWCPSFSRAVFHENFAQDRDIASPEVMGGIVEALGQPGAAVLARATSDEIKGRLRKVTEEAMKLGIFGAPSFTVGNELFWGNDRLEQALRWAAR